MIRRRAVVVELPDVAAFTAALEADWAAGGERADWRTCPGCRVMLPLTELTGACDVCPRCGACL